MAIEMTNNFNGVPGGSFLGDENYSATGSVRFVEAHYGVGVRFAPGGGWLGQVPFPAVTKRVFSRIYKLSNYPNSNSQIFQVRNTGPVCMASIRPTGQLALHSGGSLATAIAITTDPLPLNKEFRVTFTVDGADFTAAVYPNITSTVPVQTISGTIAAGAFTLTREGNPNGSGMDGANLDLIWPVDDDATDPGLRLYVYLTADAKNGIIPKRVNVRIYDENMPAGTKTYSVEWGDGTTSGPQAASTFTHTFTKPGDWAMVPVVNVK